MPRPIIVAATLTAAALVLGACGQQNASESDVQEVLEDAGATKDQANCASSKIADELTQDELNDLAKADTAEDIPNAIEEKITPILDECLSGEGSESEGEGDGETTESTTTTTEGETTTTTSAG